MPLPDGFEEKSKEDWEKLAKSSDAAERKQVSNCLRALGYDPPVFLTWPGEDRVAKVLEHQDGGGKKSSKKATNGKSKPGKGANKSKAAAGPKPSGGGGSVDLAPLEEKVEALEAKVGELGDALDVAMEYIRESHTMMRVFFQSDENAKNNLEEVGGYFHGKLLGLEEEEEEGGD